MSILKEIKAKIRYDIFPFLANVMLYIMRSGVKFYRFKITPEQRNESLRRHASVGGSNNAGPSPSDDSATATN